LSSGRSFWAGRNDDPHREIRDDRQDSDPAHQGIGPERATLFAQAKEEALRRATQAVEDLNALGLKYRLVEGELPAGSKGVGKPQQKGQADKKEHPSAAGLNETKWAAARRPKFRGGLLEATQK
jgi:hypothetical protein